MINFDDGFAAPWSLQAPYNLSSLVFFRDRYKYLGNPQAKAAGWLRLTFGASFGRTVVALGVLFCIAFFRFRRDNFGGAMAFDYQGRSRGSYGPYNKTRNATDWRIHSRGYGPYSDETRNRFIPHIAAGCSGPSPHTVTSRRPSRDDPVDPLEGTLETRRVTGCVSTRIA